MNLFCHSIFYVDESVLEMTDDEQLDEVNKQFWKEEYLPVASRLYQRLAEGMEYFHQNRNENC